VFFRNWRDKRRNLKIYERLSNEDKFLVMAVQEAVKKGKPTVDAISSVYLELSGNPIEHSMLLEKLKYAAETGLIKRTIINSSDEPLMIWKNQTPIK